MTSSLLRHGRLIACGAAILGLSACAGGGSLYEQNSISVPAGSDFQRAQHAEYTELSKAEAAQGDWRDADHYAGKALASVRRVVRPDAVAYRKLPASTIPEIEAASRQLAGMLAGDAPATQPARAARAQAMFDCWIEQQEENFQPYDIQQCRRGFEAAMDGLGAKKLPPDHDAITIYFDLNKANLDAEDMRRIDTAVAYAGESRRVLVSGHADRSGAESYNDTLSQRRAQAVSDAMTSRGVPSRIVVERAFGESRPAVPTPDGKVEAENRRVVIRFRMKNGPDQE